MGRIGELGRGVWSLETRGISLHDFVVFGSLQVSQEA